MRNKSNNGVLLIEDRSFVRHQLRKQLESSTDYTILGVAKDLYRAYEIIKEKEPSICVIRGSYLIEHGHLVKKLLTTHQMAVIVIAEGLCYEKLQHLKEEYLIHRLIYMDRGKMVMGILDVITAIKDVKDDQDEIIWRYTQYIESTYLRRNEPVITIGASTGGVNAIEMILSELEGDLPPILIVQHMSKAFTGKMADRLCTVSSLRVKEGIQGEIIRKNVAYIAPGDSHMTVDFIDGFYRIQLDQGPMVHYQRPAVDNLFQSVANVFRDNSIGLLLTGMGKDGAKGLLEMKEKGAYTLAQDSNSCVVFGMPKAAIDIGGACEVAPIDTMAAKIEELSAVLGKSLSIRSAV